MMTAGAVCRENEFFGYYKMTEIIDYIMYYFVIFGLLFIILFFLTMFCEDFLFYYRNNWDWEKTTRNDYFYFDESGDDRQKMNGKARLFYGYPFFVGVFVFIFLGAIGYIR